MSESAGPAGYGRVSEDGTVFVRTADGERQVGQVPDADEAEALAFFVRRFEALETEVNLLAQRIGQGSLSPEEARRSIDHLRATIGTANAVGDLDGLIGRLNALTPRLAAAQEARKAERAQLNEQTRAAKEALVAEAERLAEGNDWRGGPNRFRAMLEEWRALPRIDKATDDELWHRYSSARTAYTRRRKAHYASDNERREAARRAKERIIERARQIAGSTDWGATAGEFRELMSQWKAAGSANREVDDALWSEFRGLQDQFFNSRSAAFNAEESEYDENLQAKQELLAEAEATILPVEDVKRAREAFREFLSKYNAHGKVPREAIRPLENRVRGLEQAIRVAEETEWRRTDPGARQLASDTVDKLTAQIDKLSRQVEQAEARGDRRAADRARQSIGTYTEWLQAAQRNLDEFSS